MNEHNITREVKIFQERVQAWEQPDEVQPVALRLAQAGEELNVALKTLQAAEEELRRQNRALELAGQKAEAERRRYQDLFQFAPDGYLVTDLDGTIHEANRAARACSACPSGSSTASRWRCSWRGGRRAFRAELMRRLAETSRVEEMQCASEPRNGAAFPAALTVAVTAEHGAPSGLRGCCATCPSGPPSRPCGRA